MTDEFDRPASQSRSVSVGSGGAPSAQFVFSPTQPRIGDQVFFNAAASTAPGARSIVSYDWTFGDGGTASGVAVTHVFAVALTHSVTLIVTDDQGVSSSTTSSVIVSLSKPTASFVFSPTSPPTTTTVQFNASASTVATGRTIQSYAWNFGDGTTASGVTNDHRFTTAGVYNVVLTVTDSDGEFNAVTQSVSVSDATSGTPTASFVFSPTAPTTSTLVQFNAGASTAPTGRTITTYAWDFGDGATATGATSTHVFATAGVYNVQVTVTDSSGVTDTSSTQVTVVGPPGGSPTADFVSSPTSPTTTTTVQFNGTASTATAGRTITGYAWNFGDGSTGTGVTTSHAFAAAGVYNVTLTVTDSTGATGTTAKTVTVGAATGGTPTASFVFSPTAPTTTTAVQFNGTASTAPTGLTITAFAWNFGDGTTGTGATTSHTFTTAGVYNVELTVTDSAGATDTQATAVSVVGVSSTLPTATFSVSPNPTPLGALTVVDAAASVPSNGETIVSYTWNFGDTTGTSVCPGAGGCNGAIFSHTYAASGSFIITLTVTDSAGLTDTTTGSITVSAVADPVAGFTASPNPATLTGIPLEAAVNFNGSASSASGGRTIATWEWDFGDGSSEGPSAALKTTTHDFTAVGTFTVTLTVEDSSGATGLITRPVTITGP